jgi:hypothetical protein
VTSDAWTTDRERLLALHESTTQAFDKAIMTLAGGALAVSISFIHDVAHHPRHKGIIGASWSFFVLSLLLILWSFLTSERATRRMIHQMADPDAESIPEGRMTDWLNWGSAGSFLVGVVCLVLFAVLNI